MKTAGNNVDFRSASSHAMNNWAYRDTFALPEFHTNITGQVSKLVTSIRRATNHLYSSGTILTNLYTRKVRKNIINNESSQSMANGSHKRKALWIRHQVLWLLIFWGSMAKPFWKSFSPLANQPAPHDGDRHDNETTAVAMGNRGRHLLQGDFLTAVTGLVFTKTHYDGNILKRRFQLIERSDTLLGGRRPTVNTYEWKAWWFRLLLLFVYYVSHHFK